MRRGAVIALVLAIGCGNDRATAVAGIGPAPLRRLSNTEYLYALNDLFPAIQPAFGVRTGRYVRYPRTFTSPQPNHVLLGPATNRLHVSVLRAMGQPDNSFGLTSVPDSAGGTIPLVGPLTELFS